MKSNIPHESSQQNIPGENSSPNGEVSLIDLALILIAHKKTITVIFLAFITAAIVFTLLTPKIYTYSTTIETGSQVINGTIKPFESAQALSAKIEHNYIPLILSQYKQSNPNGREKYKINPSVPQNSHITLLEIKGEESESETLVGLLNKTSQKAIQDHSRIYLSLKNSLEVRLKQRIADLNFLKNNNNNETEVVSNRIHIENLSTQLANLRNTKQIQPPIRSLEPTSTSKKLIIAIFSIAGIFIGVFAAFATEFIAKVKEEKSKVTH